MRPSTLAVEFQCAFNNFKKHLIFLFPDFPVRVLKRCINRRPICTGGTKREHIEKIAESQFRSNLYDYFNFSET